ncbi:MAG: CcdB family protein [Alphaproteobacteria bacterium]|nr:CcdB family protein [Alphaproteobacteria bacterium]MBL6940220.1 CcdB family protein [Alphaproteobacteria bacterium]MBL7096872.1 CcdB family protein [Alphaproteobacteria bacterium]
MTIRQFDVVANPTRRARDIKPYLICVQHRNFDHLPTRLVAPLLVERVVKQPTRLNPELRISGERFFLDPVDLGTIPLRHLLSVVTNFESERDRIIPAIDIVFTGV